MPFAVSLACPRASELRRPPVIHRFATLAFAASICVVSACKSESEDPPTVDCTTGTIPTYAQVKPAALAKCTICHATTSTGAARLDAPVGVDFDTYEAAKKNAKQGTIEVDQGTMPPANYMKLLPDEEQAFYKWALCGTPQ
jgi:uncharacterized membrane protein